MKMRKLLVAVFAIVLFCFVAVGCSPDAIEPQNPYEKFGTEKYRVTFSDKDAIASTTICFNPEFSSENISIGTVEGFKDNAVSANIKLPDPNNVWWAMGIGFNDTNKYDGNFKNLKKIAFTYTSNVDLSTFVANEEMNIYIQIAIKSVKANPDDEQETHTIDRISFPIKNVSTPTAFSFDIPQAVQTSINASTKTLYLDWFMLAIEDAGDNFKPGKLVIDDIAFFA